MPTPRAPGTLAARLNRHRGARRVRRYLCRLWCRVGKARCLCIGESTHIKARLAATSSAGRGGRDTSRAASQRYTCSTPLLRVKRPLRQCLASECKRVPLVMQRCGFLPQPRPLEQCSKSHHATLIHPLCACAHGGLHNVQPVSQSRLDPFRPWIAPIPLLSH
jgi:hypothetical protein